MVDTGSGRTFIGHKLARNRKLVIFEKQSTIPLADKKSVAKIVGEVIVDIDINGGLHKNAVVEVIQDLCTDVIIGRDILGEHSKVVLNFNGPREDLVIGAIEPDPTSDPQVNNSNLQNVSKTPSQTFGTMNISPPPLFTHLSKNIKPVAIKSRQQSQANAAFIKEEIANLYQRGVIRPSVSPWRAQPFVTKEDGTHKRRMVIDYSETINLFTEQDAYPMPNVLQMVQEISQYKYFATFDLKSAYHQVPIREEDCKYTAFEADGQLWEFTSIPFGVTNGVSAFQRTIDKVIKVEQLSDTFAYVDNVTICGKTKEELEANLLAFYKVVEKYNLTLNDDKTILLTEAITILGYTISHNRISPDQSRLKPLLEMAPPTSLKAQKKNCWHVRLLQ